MSSSRKWNIIETRVVDKRKTRDGRKLVNNYELLQTLGQGQFGKVKLCERIPTPAVVADAAVTTVNAAAAVVTTTTVSASAAATTLDDTSDLLGPPPPPPTTTLFNGATAAAVSVTTPAPVPARRQFALKIFSKQALLKMKEYISEPATSNDATESSSAATTQRMRVVTALDHVRDEIAIMRTLFHRNVVLLFEVIESEQSDKIYLVLEYMPHGVCMAFEPQTKRFASPLTGGVLTDALAKSHIQDVLSGLAYLHARNICHRDLKPGNILLSKSHRCLLSDFGCAKACSYDQPPLVSDTVGTFQFLAPECCTGAPYDPFAADVWAVGMLLYVFLYGELPFQAATTNELFDEIGAWDVETALPSRDVRVLAPACRDLLLALLTRDPQQRISVAAARTHAWLLDNDDDDDEPLTF